MANAAAVAEAYAAYADDFEGFCEDFDLTRPWSKQIEMAEALDRYGQVSCRSAHGTGKALALDTPIPTPSGWTTMGELKVGDLVYDEKGQPCRVTFATEVMYGHKCYDVEFGNGTVVIADAGHLWRISTMSGDAIESTEQIKDRLVAPTEDWYIFGLHDSIEGLVEIAPGCALTLHTIKAIRERESVPVRCIQVDSPSHLYLCSRSFIPTHNTECLAQVVWWFSITRPKTVICITAPTFRQLVNVVFRRIRHLGERSRVISAMIKAGYIRCKPTRIDVFSSDSYVTIATAKNPEGLQGEHADPVIGSMLLILEEASGVPAEFFQAMEGAGSTGKFHVLMVGNPTRTQGKFYDSFNKERSEWHTIRISAFDAPFVNMEWVEKMRRQYGEDSDVYRVRVLGEFPRTAGDSLVPLSWMEEAVVRTPVPYDEFVGDTDGYVIGVDVARGDSDYSTVVVRRGVFILGEYIARFQGLTTTPLAGYLKALYERLALKSPVNPNNGRLIRPVICVDAIGIGSGVFDTLKDEEANVRAVVVSERSQQEFPKCQLLRDELYWSVRELFNEENDHHPIILVPEPGKTDGSQRRAALQERSECVEQMIAECSGLTFRYAVSGAIQVEDKDSYRKRNEGRSPDLCDALAISFFRNNKVPNKKIEDIFSLRRRRAQRRPGMVV